MIKNKKKEAEKRARQDAEAAKLETTSEARSYLRGRFIYWFKKLSV